METTPQIADEEELPFSLRLRLAREAAGLSRSQLARRLDMPEQNVRNWERGRSKPSYKYASALARTLPTLDMGRYLAFSLTPVA